MIISSVVTDPPNPTVNTPFAFVITILNQGDAPISMSGRYLDSTDCPGLNASTSFTLEPGETKVTRLSARPDMYVEGTMTCTLKVTERSYESDRNNNTYRFTFTVRK